MRESASDRRPGCLPIYTCTHDGRNDIQGFDERSLQFSFTRQEGCVNMSSLSLTNLLSLLFGYLPKTTLLTALIKHKPIPDLWLLYCTSCPTSLTIFSPMKDTISIQIGGSHIVVQIMLYVLFTLLYFMERIMTHKKTIWANAMRNQ